MELLKLFSQRINVDKYFLSYHDFNRAWIIDSDMGLVMLVPCGPVYASFEALICFVMFSHLLLYLVGPD